MLERLANGELVHEHVPCTASNNLSNIRTCPHAPGFKNNMAEFV